MNKENSEPFWVQCEQQLEKYTLEFNTKMNPVGFHVEHMIVDKNPIGLGYGLKMTYKELTLQHADVLVPSMHTAIEIINNIKFLLRRIQD